MDHSIDMKIPRIGQRFFSKGQTVVQIDFQARTVLLDYWPFPVRWEDLRE